MALTERLALLVTLDAKGAVQGLNQVGRAANQSLGAAETRIDRTASKFKRAGAGMLAGAGLAAAGLYKAGQAAADLEQAVGGTEAVFKDASGAIDKFAKTADQKMGLSERAFREATTRIGGQLKGVGFQMDDAADQAIKLTGVAADLAATYGGTTAEAVDALSAAFRGEADPAERFNLRLNQTTVNAKAVALGLAESTSEVSAQAKAQATLALIMEQSADAQGQFAREADTAAGAQARMSASLENLKANVGVAIAPIIGGLADTIGGLTDSFNSLPAPAQATISKVAAFGTIAVGAAGGLSFVIGKSLEFKRRLDDLAVTAPRTAAAISGIGKAAATLGILATVGQLLDDAFSEDHTGDINKIENALVRLGQGEALGDLDKHLKDAREGFSRILDPSAGERLQDVEDKISSLGGLLGDSNRHLNDAREAVEGFDRALAQLALRDPGKAAAALAQVARDTGYEVDDLLPLLDNYESALAGIDTDARTAADGTDEFGDAAAGAKGDTEGLTQAIDDQREAYKKLVNATLGQFDASLAYRNSVADVADALDELNGKTEDGTKTVKDSAKAQRDLAAAQRDRESAARRVQEAQSKLNELERRGWLGGQEYEDAVRALQDAQDAEADAADSVLDKQESLNEQTSTGARATEDHEEKVRALEGAMLNQAEAAVELARRNAEAAGKTFEASDESRVFKEELRKLAGELAPGSQLRLRLEEYIDQLNEIPPVKVTTIEIAVSEASKNLLEKFDPGNVIGLGSVAPTGPANDLSNTSATGGLVPSHLARGGFPGGPRGTDTIPTWLTPGEYVVRKKAVDRLGVGFMDWLNAGSFPSSEPTANGIDMSLLVDRIARAISEMPAGATHINFERYEGESQARALVRAVDWLRYKQTGLAVRS